MNLISFHDTGESNSILCCLIMRNNATGLGTVTLTNSTLTINSCVSLPQFRQTFLLACLWIDTADRCSNLGRNEYPGNRTCTNTRTAVQPRSSVAAVEVCPRSPNVGMEFVNKVFVSAKGGSGISICLLQTEMWPLSEPGFVHKRSLRFISESFTFPCVPILRNRFKSGESPYARRFSFTPYC